MSKTPPPRPNLLRYHRPKILLSNAPIPQLSVESKACLRTLSKYSTPKATYNVPRSRCAAVLVALFVGRAGDLYVLLSRRSSTLRTFPGDTALPGGKTDEEDRTMEDTARREAFEEIGLPIDRARLPLLCILEPFLAGNQLVVTPVVVLILDNTLEPILNASEVDRLFSHPLAAFLTSSSPFEASESESLEAEYHTYTDWKSNSGQLVRGHRFLTGREAGGIKPVFGLTAGILIETARIGYGRAPDFEVTTPGQWSSEKRIVHALLNEKVFEDAFSAENLDPKTKLLQSILDANPKDVQRVRRRRDGSRL